VGACDHVLSYKSLNVVASRGPSSGVAYPVLKPQVRLLGAQVCPELGGDEADWVDRWRNPHRPCHPRWGKVLVRTTPMFSSF
jgi:hypothetical protein